MELPHFRDFIPTDTAIAPVTPKMPKLIRTVGVTGDQGGWVARCYLKDPNYRIRGTTGDLTSPAAQTITRQGVELGCTDLDHVENWFKAFERANVIFGVTNCWKSFFKSDGWQNTAEEGICCRRNTYEVEAQQPNTANAAATMAVDRQVGLLPPL